MSSSSIERIALLVAVAVGTATQVRSCEQAKAYEARVASANAVADTFKAKYDGLSATFEDRLNTLFDATEIMALMRQQNGKLADRLEDLDAELISITTAVAGLEESFGGTAPVTPTATGWTFPIFERHDYDESWLAIRGSASVDTLGLGSWDLSVEGRLGITTSISRLPDDQIRVDLFSDVPSLNVYDLTGAQSIVGLEGQGSSFGWWKVIGGGVIGFILGRL
jgi:hypothetical protein